MISKSVVLFFLIRYLEISSFCVDVWKKTMFKLHCECSSEIPILKGPCFFVVWWWTTKTFTLCKFLEGVFNTVVSVWCCYCSKSLFIACIDLREAFFNYVEKIFAFFWPPTYPWFTFVNEFLFFYKGKSAYCWHFQ